MPGSISRPSSGSGGRDLSVDGRRCSRMPDLRGFMFSVSFLWVIEVVAVLPGHLQYFAVPPQSPYGLHWTPLDSSGVQSSPHHRYVICHSIAYFELSLKIRPIINNSDILS